MAGLLWIVWLSVIVATGLTGLLMYPAETESFVGEFARGVLNVEFAVNSIPWYDIAGAIVFVAIFVCSFALIVLLLLARQDGDVI